MRLVKIMVLGGVAFAQDNPDGLLVVRRIYVDKLNGGETAVQMRDMIIAALQSTKRFTITENPDRADATLRGSAEDLVFTDTFSSSEGVHARASLSDGINTSKTSRKSAGLSVGDSESTRIAERKHEATATVRLVNKDGDVIWSTTQESFGAKFRGASADVADKVTKQLILDLDKALKVSPPKA